MKYIKLAWEFLRKPTTPLHIVYGLWCAFMMYAFGFLIGGVCVLGFALWERWNDQNEVFRHTLYIPEGDWDWWESAVPLCVSMAILGILQCLNVIQIGVLP